jgi:hypothetical protein
LCVEKRVAIIGAHMAKAPPPEPSPLPGGRQWHEQGRHDQRVLFAVGLLYAAIPVGGAALIIGSQIWVAANHPDLYESWDALWMILVNIVALLIAGYFLFQTWEYVEEMSAILVTRPPLGDGLRRLSKALGEAFPQ